MSFPPLIIHLTAGSSTDGSPEPMAEAIRKLRSEDGHALLFHCHLSGIPAPPLLFPTSEDELADEESRRLFRLSSRIPERLRRIAATKGVEVSPGARGMVSNYGGEAFLNFFALGTLVGDTPFQTGGRRS